MTIAVDTSALMAIALDEPTAQVMSTAIESADRLLISATTVAEALIVAERRNVGEAMNALISGLGFEIVASTGLTASRVANIYNRWGKGIHPASLNFGDCFAYDVAIENDCPLLFVGNDFSQTNVKQWTVEN